MKCRKCGSENIEIIDHQGAKVMLCKDCGYDERDDLDIFPEEKTSQKAKGRFSPYKAGGPSRTKK